jgi:hypothetical protein
MSKSIIQFRHEPYGLFIDLVDVDAAVAVHPRTGEILLDEGDGSDRFHGAAISPTSFNEFHLIEKAGGSAELVLNFGCGRSHSLGSTTNCSDASRWIKQATGYIEAARNSRLETANHRVSNVAAASAIAAGAIIGCAKGKSSQQRGTTVWAYKRFLSDGLVCLLNDLSQHETDGFSAEEFEKVDAALRKIVNATAAIPDRTFGGMSLLAEMERFSQEFTRWNCVDWPEGDALSTRRMALRRMRERRHRMASITRKNQLILESVLDQHVVEQYFQALEGLVDSTSFGLPGVAKAVSRLRRNLKVARE